MLSVELAQFRASVNVAQFVKDPGVAGAGSS
jgi:hypothetical protein